MGHNRIFYGTPRIIASIYCIIAFFLWDNLYNRIFLRDTPYNRIYFPFPGFSLLDTVPLHSAGDPLRGDVRRGSRLHTLVPGHW